MATPLTYYRCIGQPPAIPPCGVSGVYEHTVVITDRADDMNYSGDDWWCEKCATSWNRNGEQGRYDPA